MYYLEDKHPSYEFTCYIQVKSGTPYIGTWRADNMFDVYRYIREIEKRHGSRRQRFYIDNDFYNNKYTNSDYAYYYRFMQRKVNDWETISIGKKLIKLVK